MIVALTNVANNSFGYSPEIRCIWNCSVHEADLTGLKRQMETSTSNQKAIRLGVQYEKIVDANARIRHLLTQVNTFLNIVTSAW